MVAVDTALPEVLVTMTSVAADACRLADRKGRIAVGYDADLLAVDGDPTQDRDAIHRIHAVYARGRLVRNRPRR